MSQFEGSSIYKMLRYDHSDLSPSEESISTKISDIKSIAASKSQITILDKNGSTYYRIVSNFSHFNISYLN